VCKCDLAGRDLVVITDICRRITAVVLELDVEAVRNCDTSNGEAFQSIPIASPTSGLHLLRI
jgi:hypothetical protein